MRNLLVTIGSGPEPKRDGSGKTSAPFLTSVMITREHAARDRSDSAARFLPKIRHDLEFTDLQGR